MKVGAIIIDNREDIAEKALQLHKPFIPKEWDIMAITGYEIHSIADYNNLLTSPHFWRGCRFDRVLIFQHDSRLLRHGVERFLEWDYIGAPIKHMPGYMNGGLSIRNPKLMYQICKLFPYGGMSVDGNEDIYFVKHLRLAGAKLPTHEQAEQFSIETTFRLGSIGCHAIEKYLTPEQVKQVYQ